MVDSGEEKLKLLERNPEPGWKLEGKLKLVNDEVVGNVVKSNVMVGKGFEDELDK